MGRARRALLCFCLLVDAPGCSQEIAPGPPLDDAVSATPDSGAAPRDDLEPRYCGDRICDFPRENLWNCAKDCLPDKKKADNPFEPYDPGFVDPVPISKAR